MTLRWHLLQVTQRQRRGAEIRCRELCRIGHRKACMVELVIWMFLLHGQEAK